jgi:type II secretory pathway component GspD/PulD (secretin)
MMKHTGKALILSTVLALTAFIQFSYAQDDDFISVSPVEKQDASNIQPATAVKGRKAAAETAPTAGPTVVVKRGKKEPANRAETTIVKSILTVELNDVTEIRIITSAPVKQPKATMLGAPPNPRILVQISDCSVGSGTRPVGKGGVTAVRTAQHSSSAWIVVDLKKDAKWKVSQDYSTIIVSIDKTGDAKRLAGPESAGKVSGAPETVPGSFVYRLIDVNAKNLGAKTRIIVTTDGPVKYRVRKDSSDKKITLNLIDSISLWQKGSLKMDDGAVREASVNEDGKKKVTNVVLSLAYNTPYTVSKDQNQIVIDMDNQPQGTGGRDKKLDLYQKISINVQSAELPGVLRLLSSQTGFQFSAGPAVDTAAAVTINEDNQTLEQVLKDILIPRNLYYEVNNGIIRVGDIAAIKLAKGLMKKVTRFYSPKNMSDIKQLQSMLTVALTKEQFIDVASQVDGSPGANRIMVVGTRDDVDKAMDILADIDVAGNSSDEGENTIKTKVFKLDNIRLNPISTEMGNLTKNDMETKQLDDIKNAITPMLTTGIGSMSIDRRTSSIIITDTGAVINKVGRLIKALDVKLPQVSIEAKLYEISVTAEHELGINWNLNGKANEPSATGTANLNPLDLTNGGGSLTLGSIQNGLNISATLSALEGSSKAKLLSAPKITVEANMPATIMTSRAYYYEVQTNVTNNGSLLTTSTFSSVDLPIQLKVYCKVTKDGYINMSVDALVDRVEPTTRTQGPPDVNTQEASTYVKAKNNETIVMGGLINDDIVEQVQKVPLLGDLPLIGGLFSGTTKTTDKEELIIFITPSIVEDSD